MTMHANSSLYTNIDDKRMLALEEAAFAAWPAADVEQLAGWRLRATDGVTRRANSAWAIQEEGELGLEARIAAVEEFYARRGLPACFQVNSAVLPPGLDALLARRGYYAEAPTLVQTAPLTTIFQTTPTLRALPHLEIEISEEFEEEWFALYEANEQHTPTHAAGRAAILQRAPAPCAFATATVDGVRAAVGLGVVTGDHLGIFCMSTAPTARRRGAANGLLRALAIWAQMMDAKLAYLQVMESNEAACELYGRAGFATVYNYHYRIRPSGAEEHKGAPAR